MESIVPLSPGSSRKAWGTALALTWVYVSWGTTYLAVKEGVRSFPPALFGGFRVTLAGLCIFLPLLLAGEMARVRRRDILVSGLAGLFLFIGGNGLIHVAEMTVDSGLTAVLVAMTPFWVALLESLIPGGERLTMRGWIGIFFGMLGVILLLIPDLGRSGVSFRGGPILVLISSFNWALGAILLRHLGGGIPALPSAALQMVIGGGGLTLVGLSLGEWSQIDPVKITAPVVGAFVYLFLASSLGGFLAYNWLLYNTTPSLASTYAYVNPAVAILVGWLWGGEAITPLVIFGMMVILLGVGLVSAGSRST